MPLRCYLYATAMGDVYRWYEVVAEQARMVLSLGEYKEGLWRLRPVEQPSFPLSYLDLVVESGKAVRLG